MCLICRDLSNHRMTVTEAESAAMELVVCNALFLKEEGKLEHTIDLLESLQNLDLERLSKVVEDGNAIS